MKSKFNSKSIPRPTNSSIRKFAHNRNISWIEEVRCKVRRYNDKNSNFKIHLQSNDNSVKVKFGNKSYSNQIKIQKVESSLNPSNTAFGVYEYNDVELMSLSLKSNSGQFREYIKAVYWGSVRDDVDCEEFVRENAKIIKTRYPLRTEKTYPKPNSNSNSFVATDVGAYTKERTPNPWCRNCILPLYENQKIIDNLRSHSELGIKKSDLNTVLQSEVATLSDFN